MFLKLAKERNEKLNWQLVEHYHENLIPKSESKKPKVKKIKISKEAQIEVVIKKIKSESKEPKVNKIKKQKKIRKKTISPRR